MSDLRKKLFNLRSIESVQTTKPILGDVFVSAFTNLSKFEDEILRDLRGQDRAIAKCDSDIDVEVKAREKLAAETNESFQNVAQRIDGLQGNARSEAPAEVNRL